MSNVKDETVDAPLVVEEKSIDAQEAMELRQDAPLGEREEKAFPLYEAKASEDERGIIEGYAAYFGNVDRQQDIIRAGTFKNGQTVPIFGHHRPDLGIGTGVVKEDERGLRIRIKLEVDNPDSETLRERARDFYAQVKSGIIRRMSVGMIVTGREYKKRKVKGEERVVRYITAADLLETSLVPIPANDRARVMAVKAAAEALEDGSDEAHALLKEMEALTDRVAALEESNALLRKAVALSVEASLAELERDEEDEGDEVEKDASEVDREVGQEANRQRVLHRLDLDAILERLVRPM